MQKEKGPEAAPRGLREMLTKTLSPPHFLKTGSLATQAAEEKELGATDTSRTNFFDLVHHLGVQREDTLHALTKAHLADGERSLRALLLANHNAFKGLQTLLLAL